MLHLQWHAGQVCRMHYRYDDNIYVLGPFIYNLGIDENDEDGASIAKLLTGFCETYIDHVAEQLADPSIRMLLDMIMQLTGFPGTFCVDQEVSDIPLNFWFMLQETLFDNGIVPIRQPVAIVTNGVDDAATAATTTHENDPAQRAWLQQCGETAMMVYRQLVVVLKRQSTFPDDATWTSWPKGKKGNGMIIITIYNMHK